MTEGFTLTEIQCGKYAVRTVLDVPYSIPLKSF